MVLPAPLIVTTPPLTRIYETLNPAFTVSITGLIPPDTLSSIGLTGSPTFSVTGGFPDSNVGTQLTITPGLGDLSFTSPNYVLTLVPSTITVACCEPQLIAPSSLPSGLTLPVGTPFSLSGISTTGLPLTFTVLSGPGVINTSPFGVTVTATGTTPIAVQVTAVGNANISAAPPVVVTFNPALTVNAGTTLPAGVLNVAYTATRFTASGGKPPYTWSASGLPLGLRHQCRDRYCLRNARLSRRLPLQRHD